MHLPDQEMNRRSFITKALAGLAAIPLLGKLAQAVESPSGWMAGGGYFNPVPSAFGSAWYRGHEVFNVAGGPIRRVTHITVNAELCGFDLRDPVRINEQLYEVKSIRIGEGTTTFELVEPITLPPVYRGPVDFTEVEYILSSASS